MFLFHAGGKKLTLGVGNGNATGFGPATGQQRRAGTVFERDRHYVPGAMHAGQVTAACHGMKRGTPSTGS